jgi:hypothetical protein
VTGVSRSRKRGDAASIGGRGVDATASPQLEPALAAALAFDDPIGGAQDKGLCR